MPEHNDNDDQFLTRTEAARLMRLHPRTLGNLAAKRPRQGPPFMKTSALAGRALYRRSAVIAFMEQNAAVRTLAPTPTDKPASRRRATASRPKAAHA
jgi:hypothetical protein